MTFSSEGMDAGKAGEIQKVRRVATGILIFLSLVFAATFAVSDPPLWLLLIRAMAEAGMVGGIADWFAVEALFRHPLGLPIPHTALLPKNQKRAAGNIARFIDEYFLVPDQLLEQVQRFNPAHRLARWLTVQANATLVAREAAHLLQLLVRSQLRGGLGAQPTRFLRDLMLNAVNSGTLAEQITRLLKGSVHSQVLDEILIEVRNVLDQNRGKVMQVVQDRSRWWIASSVDRQIVRVLVDGILSIIDELADPSTELRQEFETSVSHMIEGFQQSGRIAHHIDDGIGRFAESPEFAEALATLVTAILEEIDRDFSADPDRVAGLLSEAISEFARMLLERPDMERSLNARLMSGLETVLEDIRPATIRYITRTIADWDSEQLVVRMEAEVGRDLQFIRINGAVLGAFVGGVLFFVTHLNLVF